MTDTADLSLIRSIYASLGKEEKAAVDELLAADTDIWVPLPGPQSLAFDCDADFLFYGGAAGGGKSDLAVGLALTAHQKSIIYRREGTQLIGIIQRVIELLGGRDGYNGSDKIWKLPNGSVLEFGAVKDIGDEIKYQGRPHDLKVFDEITHFAELQFRFLCGWMRSNDPGQRQRVLCTGNPPTTPEGRWVIRYWAPWLDVSHPNPAEPGELRWFAVIDGEDVEVDGPEPFEHTPKGGEPELITPKSRSFIPSRIEDNPHYMETGYKATLQALPEPLRSQMLQGNFGATTDDPADQIIPTSWIQAAQARWTPKEDPAARGPMDSMGCDPARGGRDKTIITRRHGGWFDELLEFPGGETPDGPTVASLVVANRRDAAPVHVDVIGVGGSVVDFLKTNGVQTIAVNGSSTGGADITGLLRFANLRAELHWRMREALDPANGHAIQLPVDQELLSDLAATRYKVTPSGILAESKIDVKKRIGRSPDRGDAVIYALISTMKTAALDRSLGTADFVDDRDYNPLGN